jgi:hypothetical protein
VNAPSGVCPEKVRLCVRDTEVLGGKAASLRREAAILLDLTLLRIAPLGLKRSVYDDGRWRVAPLTRDERLAHFVVTGNNVLRELGARLDAAPRPPTAKFLHLFGTHLPMVLDDRCAFTGETVRWSRAAYATQVRCALEALREVLVALRRNGVYDNTTIVLLADHGTPGMASARVGPQPADVDWKYQIGIANPTLAVKPAGAKGRLRRSDQPASIADVAAIVCEAAGLCAGRRRDPGASRVYNSFVWSQSYVKLDRIPDITGYEIRGSLFERASWHRIEQPGGGGTEGQQEYQGGMGASRH